MRFASFCSYQRTAIADISPVTQARALLELMVFWLIHIKDSIINLIMLLPKMGQYQIEGGKKKYCLMMLVLELLSEPLLLLVELI